MSATEIIKEIDRLPVEDQKEIFVFLTKKVISAEVPSKQWLGKKLSFEEACDVVFRENRELLSALAK
jgi:hypothetical protein